MGRLDRGPAADRRGSGDAHAPYRGSGTIRIPGNRAKDSKMRDEYSLDGYGLAQFSDNDRMRYRLARTLISTRLVIVDGVVQGLARIVWLLLNPSTANAFRPDPTVTECVKRSITYGGDVCEVVNLFAMRSPYPADLWNCLHGQRGDDAENDRAILQACVGAKRVVAAWGNHGALDNRDQRVRNMLQSNNVPLVHLGLTQSGMPKHPLARGKHRIPKDQQPAVFA